MSQILNTELRDNVYTKLNTIIKDVKEINIGLPMVWLWCWDIVVDIYENNQWVDMHNNLAAEECIAQDVTLKQIWDKFWDDSDTNGFSLEFGVERLDEHIWDWMRESNFLVPLDNDSWLSEAE